MGQTVVKEYLYIDGYYQEENNNFYNTLKNDLDIWSTRYNEGKNLSNVQECYNFLKRWPRGDGPGELLEKPVFDSSVVGQRGISLDWMKGVVDYMISSNLPKLPTRCVVEHFIKPLTETFVYPLYFFIPEQYRCIRTPDTFISHSWDSLFIQLFLSPFVDGSNPDTSFWLDIFAINQHDYEGAMKDIKDIVQSCNKTLLVLPGFGRPFTAMLPLSRSWCILEIIYTKSNKLRIVPCSTIVSQPGSFNTHMEYLEFLENMSVKTATSWDPQDKKDIDELVLSVFGSFFLADQYVKNTIIKGFYEVYRLGCLSKTSLNISNLYNNTSV